MGFWNPSSSDESSRGHSSQRRHQRSSARGASSNNPFNFFTASSSRSYGSSRARPRDGFVARVRRFLLKIYDYMRRNPTKVFFLVILPLITGGALTRLLRTVGIRLPRGVENLMAQLGGRRGVVESERIFARGGARDFAGGTSLPGMVGGIGESIGGLMGMARMFI